MRAFSDGKIAVLVSTTVVEVGVDVPNATVMAILMLIALDFLNCISCADVSDVGKDCTVSAYR